MANNHIDFGVDLLPVTSLSYNLGSSSSKWNIYGDLTGNASTATGANIASTTNAVAIYTDTIGTFGYKSSTNGALYATTANGTVQWGTLPVAQGGTGLSSVTLNAVLIGNSSSTTGNMQAVASTSGAFYATTANGKPQFGTLPTALGGTGKATWTANAIVYASTTLTLALVAAGTSTNANLPLLSGGAAAPGWYAGATFTGTQASDYLLTLSGRLKFTSTTGIKHIEFSRTASTGPSYICYPSDGQLAIGFNTGADNIVALFDNTSIKPGKDLTYALGDSTHRWSNIYTNVLHVQGASSNPSTSAGARIEFTYDSSTTDRSQPVYISYTPNDAYRAPAGLKILGGTNATPAWFDVEGSIYAGTTASTDATEHSIVTLSNSGIISMYSIGNANSNGNRGIYINAHGTGSAYSTMIADTNNTVTYITRNADVTIATTSNNSVSTNKYWGYKTTDLAGNNAALFYCGGYTDGSIIGYIEAYNKKTDGTQVTNVLGAGVQKDGTQYYSVSNADAFRSAIFAPSTTGSGASGTWAISVSGTAAGQYYQYPTSSGVDITSPTFGITSLQEKLFCWIGDIGGRGLGRLYFLARTDGKTYVFLQARPAKSDNTVGDFLGIGIIGNRDNTVSYTIACPSNFRSAFGGDSTYLKLDGTNTMTGTINSTASIGLIVKPSGARAYIQIVPLGDYQADLVFGRNNSSKWSFTSRTSSDAFFALYNSTTTNWAIRFRESDSSIMDSLIISGAGERYIQAYNTNTSCKVLLDSSPTYHGVWSSGYWDGSTYTSSNLWLIYRSTDSYIHFGGTAIADNTFYANGYIYTRVATPWPSIHFGTRATTTTYTLVADNDWGVLYYQAPSKNNSSGNYYGARFYFREYTHNGAGTKGSNYEQYFLPAATTNLSSNPNYYFYTTKNIIVKSYTVSFTANAFGSATVGYTLPTGITNAMALCFGSIRLSSDNLFISYQEPRSNTTTFKIYNNGDRGFSASITFSIVYCTDGITVS